MRPKARSRVALFAAWLGVVLGGGAASAQTSRDVGKADALFNAGRSLLEAGEYADACPKFAESQALAPGLGVTLYLADCYERLGRTASALAEFKRAVTIAATRGDKRGSVAAARATALEGKVPRLTILVTPAARAQGVTVTRDGEPVPASAWDVPVTMNPGTHEIVASAPAKARTRTKVELAPRATNVTTTIAALADPAPVVVPSSSSLVEAARAAPATPAPATRKWIGLAEAGVGLVGVGLGIGFGVVAISKEGQSNQGPCNGADRCTPAGLSLRSQAESFGNASTIAFVVGGVAIASGAVLYLTAPKGARGSEGISIAPLLSFDVAGIQARSSF